MTKVVKVYLLCNVTDRDGKKVDYKVVNRILWDLQNETQVVKNKTVQLCWEWFNFQSEYKNKHGDYPKPGNILHYTALDGYANNKLKIGNSLHSGSLTTSIRDVCKHFRRDTKEYIKGTKALVNYKQNQPLDLHNRSITLKHADDNFVFTLALLNKAGNDKYNIQRFEFTPLVKDKSTRCILERCIDGIYKISASELMYDRKKKMWKLNLNYTFTSESTLELDKDTILGVDLGVSKPIVASMYGDKSRFIIQGNEILAFRAKVEQRKKALQKQSRYCGNGRVGHGIKTRTQSIDKLSTKIACFRETTNFKYAKALVEYAVKNNCGTIQMEDLSGISSDDAFLKQWSYFDLQQKITNKAAEYGIEITKINPKYTSQRCSKCGFIHKDNRLTQSKFECLQCGFKENADYNASQNISIRDIDKIIESANIK
jgi:IS605 OrfB family transposase